MKIIYIEPYMAGSHRVWIEAYKRYTSHEIEIISLPSSRWKWRMHGGAITLSEMLNKVKKQYDLIICSDYINLPVFKSFLNKTHSSTPTVIYFHENQPAYPWAEHDKDLSLKRDFHYYYINQTSAMLSDWNFFNSSYNMSSFIDNLNKYLDKMPDYRNLDTIKNIKSKSSILHLGCDLINMNSFNVEKKINAPVILWNHRWEYDKNPDLFFSTLKSIKSKNIEFKLIVCGQEFKRSPDIFNSIFSEFKNEIVHYGYCDSREEYVKLLWQADILPVTSNQDFFGISIVEAVYCNTYPILPNRLTYPEIFCIDLNQELFYSSDSELETKLIMAIDNYKRLDRYSGLVEKYDWSNMVSMYDDELKKVSCSNV